MKKTMIKGLIVFCIGGLLVGCSTQNKENETENVTQEAQVLNKNTEIESENLNEITVENVTDKAEEPLILKNHMNATVIVGDNQEEIEKIENTLEEIKTIKVKTFTPERPEAKELIEAYHINTPNFIVIINHNTDEIYKITYPNELKEEQLKEIKEIINTIMNA